MSKLESNTFFTTLDMTPAKYQIPLYLDSKMLTLFITLEGLFEFNVKPFRLRNAPMVFQKIIIQFIRGLRNRNKIISYVDEVIIATKTVSEGVEVLAGYLRLKPRKCMFMARKVKFLGYVVGHDGISPGRENTNSI